MPAQAESAYDKAGLDASGAIKDVRAQAKAAEATVAMRQKLAKKLAKKEEKKREAERRAAEEAARKAAEVQAALEREQAKREAKREKERRERELINQALRGGLGAENQEPVPELKAVAPPSVSEDALARAKMTGTEIAAAKKRAAEEAKQREKEEKVAAKAESDRLRKIAEDEGDRLFAAAEAALSSGDVDAARANEQAATAAYESRKIARTTTLRKLREQIKVAAKALDAKRRAEAQAAAARAAEEEAAREREAARVAQLKELQDKAARAADIQAKAQQSGAKIPTFIASQMASGPSSTAPVAPAGPPKVSAELRSAAQMTGAELAAVKKAERDAANQQAKAEAKAAAESRRKQVDALVAAGDQAMEAAASSMQALAFGEAKVAMGKATELYASAGVNRSASLKKLAGDLTRAEKANAKAAAAAEKQRIADEKAAAAARAAAEAAAAQKAKVATELAEIQAAAEVQAEMSAKGGVKMPMFMARQAVSSGVPELKAPPRGGATVAEAPPQAQQAEPVQAEVSPPLRVAAPSASVAEPVAPSASAEATPASPAPGTPSSVSASPAMDDIPAVDWAAKLDALKKASTERLESV